MSPDDMNRRAGILLEPIDRRGRHRERAARERRQRGTIQRTAAAVSNNQGFAATATRPGTGALSSLRADNSSSRCHFSPAAPIEAPFPDSIGDDPALHPAGTFRKMDARVKPAAVPIDSSNSATVS